jgi:hypothetical protein
VRTRTRWKTLAEACLPLGLPAPVTAKQTADALLVLLVAGVDVPALAGEHWQSYILYDAPKERVPWG